MAVLRDIASSFDEEFAKLIQRQDIAFEGRGGETTYRITCGDLLNPSLKDISKITHQI
jgi:hypothetical protein